MASQEFRKALKDEVFARLGERIEADFTRGMDSIMIELASEMRGESFRGYGGLYSRVVDRLAEKFVEDNFLKISEALDIPSLVKMVQLDVVRKLGSNSSK